MPAGREQIANTPLSGAELRAILIADFTRLVESHGLLSNHVAYGRIGYEIVLRLHPANATFRDNTPAAQEQYNTDMRSRSVAGNLVNANPALAAVEPPPLAGATDEDSVVVGTKLTRGIDSPNVERLREGLPIPTSVRDQSGATRIEMVHREPATDLGPGNVRVDDDTDAARAAWKLPPEPPVQNDDDLLDTVPPEIQDEIDSAVTIGRGMVTPPPADLVPPASAPVDPSADRVKKVADFFGVDPSEIADPPSIVAGAKMATYPGSDPT